MRDFAFLWRALGEPKLARHATGARPAWLWSTDGQKLIFANPVAAAMAGNGAEPAGRKADADHPAARQIAQIAGSLPPSGAWRLERLRGLGAGLGRPLTCACQLLTLDGTPSVLVAAIEQAGPRLTLGERVRRLFADSGEAIAVYGAGGELLFATPEAAVHLVVTTPAAESRSETLQLGEGDAVVRARRWLAPASPAAERPGTASPAANAATVDLAPIAEAIGEAQKAMAARAAAQPDSTVHPQPGASAPERRHPVRFVWTIDADNRFSIEPGEFTQAIGGKIAAELGRPWISIAADLGLDPGGEVARAIASRDTWSGITVAWPAEGSDERLTVELAGLPVYDRERNFRGYRGFGVCRDLARIAALRAARAERDAADAAAADAAAATSGEDAESAPADIRPALSVVPAADNVVPFRASSNDNQGALNPHERNAFQELASRLTERLKSADEVARATAPGAAAPLAVAEPPAPAATPEPHVAARRPQALDKPTKQDRPLLDLLPVGILIYRHAHFFYANRAFLRWSGHDSVQDFADAGGLDTLFIEPQANDKEQTLRIAAPDEKRSPAAGHLFSIPWNGGTAMMLVLIETRPDAADMDARAGAAPSLPAILDVAADGAVTLDRQGRILAANAAAARLFGYEDGQLTGLDFAALFAPEDAALARMAIAGKAASTREIAGRSRGGEPLPLAVAFGPLDAQTFCAVFQDLSRWKATERELIGARKQAEAASAAKSDFLAKVSHEIRTPLNAIIGFSELMMNERFGPVGNERYKEYLKDIHASGTHVVSLVNDLLDLSKIESGKLDLSFEPVNLNDLTQQSVALMQAEASRERVIIRTSLASELPQVVADARSVRQMVLNLLSNSIKFTGAGGQVILSTARTDHGEAVLRIRDTGIGMSEKDIATALEPFRQLATLPKSGTQGTGLGLPLTKALAEANSARFSIRSALNAGTLVEIVFPAVRAAE